MHKAIKSCIFVQSIISQLVDADDETEREMNKIATQRTFLHISDRFTLRLSEQSRFHNRMHKI